MRYLPALLGRSIVQRVTTVELQRFLDNPEQNGAMVLVDVRSEQETAVSMLPGAISYLDFERDPQRYADRTVIAYCTVGGRSLLFAQRWGRRGFRTINYQESLLGWCDNGGPLASVDGKSTLQVHPYLRCFALPEPYVSVLSKQP